MTNIEKIVNEKKFEKMLSETKKTSSENVLRILNKGLEKKGLELEEVAYLLNVEDENLLNNIFEVSSQIKKDIYGDRLVFFAPLYVSNFCINDCSYCGFASSNSAQRKKLSLDEVKKQVKILEEMGHKRLLLEFGEDKKQSPIDYVTEVIKTIYETTSGNGEIRRVNVNLAATNVSDYKKLKEAEIGTYQLFQETYHQETYKKLHKGPKSNFERQLFAHDRAFEAGLDDVGLGVLFGLYDYKFEALSLVSHSKYLEEKFGVGPHTFSVPRVRPIENNSFNPEYEVSEDELLKTIATLRIAVPYTGMIISTRESESFREKAFDIGISQTSAASRTSPAGYGNGSEVNQFLLSDERSVSEVIEGVLDKGLIPSFCTACYREGRTGEKFMDLSKPGNIKYLCEPNAILTFKEYLIDYGSSEIKEKGLEVIDKYLGKISNDKIREETINRLKQIEEGKRDLYF
jgi:2-iminoacetate synthase